MREIFVPWCHLRYNDLMSIGRIILFCFLSFLTVYALTHPWVYVLDEANLIFHEAGHTLMPFGEVVNLLGGSLFQLLVPLAVVVSFVRRREFFSALVALWWMGESMLGVARYVADARAQELTLLGGDHDFAVLFAHWPWLFPYDTMIGGVIRGVGIAVMVSTLAFLLVFIVAAQQKTPSREARVS